MDFAILSDIHSNYIALKKCVEYALERNIDHFIFLGDYVADLPFPKETMQYLYEINKKYSCTFIKGNKEDYWLDYHESENKNWRDKNSTTGNLWYGYHNLSEVDLQFFKTLPFCSELSVEGMESFTICHGTPYTANENMYVDMKRIREVMEKDKNSIIICGHVHWQSKIEYRGNILLNAGSVGMPYFQGGNLTQFLILHGNNGKWQEEFVNLYYDTEEVISHIYKSGMYESAPYWCKVSEYILRNGSPDISPGVVLEKTMELCKKHEGKCDWYNIPEKYWALAYDELCGGANI